MQRESRVLWTRGALTPYLKLGGCGTVLLTEKRPGILYSAIALLGIIAMHGFAHIEVLRGEVADAIPVNADFFDGLEPVIGHDIKLCAGER